MQSKIKIHSQNKCGRKEKLFAIKLQEQFSVVFQNFTENLETNQLPDESQ